jgi:hypothetical protein
LAFFHHLLIGRLQPFACAWAGSTLRLQAEMDLAQLVHQLGPHGRTAVAEQLGANAEFFRKGQIFVTPGSHLREDRQQLDALFGQLDALLLVGGASARVMMASPSEVRASLGVPAAIYQSPAEARDAQPGKGRLDHIPSAQSVI